MRFWPEPKRERADGKRFLSWPEPLTRSRVGVVLVNLGTPEAPTAPAIRKYLREFLSDPRVIEIPKWLWWPILNGPILMARPRKLAPRYQSIWMEGGSPLLVYTQRQTAGVQRILSERGLDVQVQTGMRYGKPSIQDAMLKLRDSGCEHILVVPMYPQYASSTTATVVDEAARVAGRMRNQPALRFIKRFHTAPAFLQPLADKISALWLAQGRPQKLVMSFHGLPRQCVDIGDPYCRDSYETARALATLLGLSDDQYLVTFQSRFGPAKWLEPYTEPTLQKLAQQGVTNIDVVCPGFLADCLETLEEISIEVRETFLHAGGKQFRYIPALNDDPAWMVGLADLVESQLQGWPVKIDK
jgi:ferrochelatase